ncbi:MAG: erythromycin esterase family protein [Pirellula sp.]|jgi:erythromycin esterase-like protein
MICQVAEPIASLDNSDSQSLLERIVDARLVLIGEATHGTSEFYLIRASITKALVQQKDLDFVAIEADFPDAYRTHNFVTHRQREEPHQWESFARFPTWVWRNHEMRDFIHLLRDYNLDQRSPRRRIGFYGFDIYSLFTSIHCVIKYLEHVDPAAASLARPRYGCLAPWKADPASYAQAALTGGIYS